MKRLTIDLELNTDGTSPTEEIIQLGYTIFDTETGEMKTGGDYVTISKPLYPFIIQLTGIKQRDIDNQGVTLQQAYTNMVQFCRDNDLTFWQIVQWGSGDDKELKEQLGTDCEWNFGRSDCNLKAMYQAYAIANGKKRSGGLKTVLKACRLNFDPFIEVVSVDGATRQRGAHDARADAQNTAKLYLWLNKRFKEVT